MERPNDSNFEETNVHRDSVLVPEGCKEGPGSGDRICKVVLGRREGLGSSVASRKKRARQTKTFVQTPAHAWEDDDHVPSAAVEGEGDMKPEHVVSDSEAWKWCTMQ